MASPTTRPGAGPRDLPTLERAGDAQGHVLAPGRGDDLHADRQRPSGTGTATTGRPMKEIGCV